MCGCIFQRYSINANKTWDLRNRDARAAPCTVPPAYALSLSKYVPEKSINARRRQIGGHSKRAITLAVAASNPQTKQCLKTAWQLGLVQIDALT